MLNRRKEVASFRVIRRSSSWGAVLWGALAAILAGSLGATPFAYIPNDDSTVSVIDTATNTVVKKILVGSFPLGVAADPAHNKVYITNSGDNTVSVINTQRQRIAETIPVGSGPEGIAVNP